MKEYYLLSLMICFFFFKQKSAYEFLIIDWSSAVCSSDLIGIDRITIARGVFRNHGCRRRRRGRQIGFASRRRRADCGRRAVKRVGVATADRTEIAPAQEISVLDPQRTSIRMLSGDIDAAGVPFRSHNTVEIGRAHV